MVNKKKQEKKERKKRDREWSLKIKELLDNKCVICGDTKILHAHHLIPREIKETRWDLENGIVLCPKHHKYSFKISAHRSPISFVIWLKENYPEKYEYVNDKIKELNLFEDCIK